jgi:hypothetical protein
MYDEEEIIIMMIEGDNVMINTDAAQASLPSADVSGNQREV